MATHAHEALPSSTAIAAPRRALSSTPPLESGDRLTRAEFERRCEQTPELLYAELLGGTVFLQAPISTLHGEPHGLIAGWLLWHSAATPGVRCGIAPSVRLGDDHMPQPDAVLRIDASRGGQSAVSPDDYIQGAPELIVEIAASSASRDLHIKKEIYRAHRVQEYLVWRVYDAEFDWFALRGDQYEPLPPGADGVLRSEVFPGLWLDRAALLAGDAAKVLGQLQLGLAAAEHAAFCARLAAAKQ